MSTATSPVRQPRATSAGLARRWLVRAIAIAALITAYSVIVINTARGWPEGIWPLLPMTINAVVATGYIVVGWLLTERRRGNLVGPLLLAFGVLWATAAPADLYLAPVVAGGDLEDMPLAHHAALYMMAIGYVMAVLATLALVLFPDGQPVNRWWLVLTVIVSGLVLLGVAAYAFGSGTFGPLYRSIDSPFRVPGFPRRNLLAIADAAAQVLTLIGFTSLAARWHRGRSVERAQVKWVALASLVTLGTGFVAEQLDDGPWDWPIVISGLVSAATGVLLPIAIGIAILRYHLYDIDRIVSRTAAYGAITAILVGVFFAVDLAMLLLATMLIGGGGGTLSTAVATLAAAALFTPVRNRAQRIVDRRFHRRHYDAQRLVDTFSARLRDQIDLGLVGRELQTAVDAAVEPAATGLWLKPGHR